MNKLLILLIIPALLLFSGCGPDSPNDGVLRNEQGNSTLGPYLDYPIMTHLQKALFEGRSYFLNDEITTLVGVSNYFLGCTPDDRDIHFSKFNAELEGTPMRSYLYKNPTIITNGTLLEPNNYNLKFPNNSSLKVYANPTLSSVGTRLFTITDFGKNNLAGGTVLDDELILNRSSCYIFEIVNNDGATANIQYTLAWHQSK